VEIKMGNIALGGNVSASNFIAPFVASRAVSGSMAATSRWVGEVPGSLNLTLNRSVYVNRWVIRHMSAVDGWPAPQYSMANYTLQGSLDGSTWRDIDTVTSNTVNVTDRTFAPVAFPFYRVNVTKGLNSNNQIASIMEFELYEVPATSQYLSNLTISSGTLTPVFNKNTYAYTASVATDVTSIVVTPTAEVPSYLGSNATITVNGTAVNSGEGITVPLNLGNNTITVSVTSAIGGVTQAYTIMVMRVNTYLSAVSIKAGRTAVNLSPSFNKSTLSYTGVSPSTSSLTVTPTADDSANVTIYIGTTTVVSGSSTSVAVTAGQVNNLSIVVKANVNSAYAETYNFAITVSN
jgi:hypothetical protein